MISLIVFKSYASEYFKTTCGLLNSVEVIASLIIFIIASNLQTYGFLTLISGFAFWISLLFLVVNLFQIPEKIPNIPWTKAVSLASLYDCVCVCRWVMMTQSSMFEIAKLSAEVFESSNKWPIVSKTIILERVFELIKSSG